MVVAHSPRPPPRPRNKNKYILKFNVDWLHTKGYTPGGNCNSMHRGLGREPQPGCGVGASKNRGKQSENCTKCTFINLESTVYMKNDARCFYDSKKWTKVFYASSFELTITEGVAWCPARDGHVGCGSPRQSWGSRWHLFRIRVRGGCRPFVPLFVCINISIYLACGRFPVVWFSLPRSF